ncbi:hypothetical protein BD769DRAFT_617305 [Suillus cothurnatus]|nr:hypothetical protein BD769DRAFT_617305 [Suillus cothurnatus]
MLISKFDILTIHLIFTIDTIGPAYPNFFGAVHFITSFWRPPHSYNKLFCPSVPKFTAAQLLPIIIASFYCVRGPQVAMRCQLALSTPCPCCPFSLLYHCVASLVIIYDCLVVHATTSASSLC